MSASEHRTISPCARVGALLLLAAALAVPRAARAEEPSAADRERARAFLFDGREKMRAGDINAAVRSFEAAHAIMNVPTTGLDLAKGLEAQRKLLEARTLALDVTRMPPVAREPAAFVQARDAARILAQELGARIPAVVVSVQAAPGAKPQVTVDGSDVPLEALGLPWKVNPGAHVVVVTAMGFRADQRTVTVKERETRKVELKLVPMAGSPAMAPEPMAAPAPGDAGAQDDRTREGVVRKVPTWAWIAGGAGLVSLGVGVAFMIDHASVRSTVSSDCPDDLCDWQRYDLAEADALEGRWNRSLGLAIGLGTVGLAGMAAAVAGIVTAPVELRGDAGKPRRGVAVAPWIGGEGAGATVLGRF